ncbi:MAG: hypothetical protein ACKOXB_10505 [Flavobacteriales bacterium]
MKVGENTTGTFTPPSSVFKAPKALVEVEIVYTKTETGLCFDISDKDFKWLNITEKLLPPNAGADAEICACFSYTLKGDKGAYSSILWTTTGDGNFDNTSKENAVYTPGEKDKQRGSVKLILARSGSYNSAPDEMILRLIPVPEVNPGRDTSTCSASVTLDAALNGMDYLWSTGATTKTISISSAGTYWVKVTKSSSGCFAYDTINVSLGNPPLVDLGKDIRPLA